MTVRILHAADLHLDSAFTALTEEQARQRRRECRTQVSRMVDYANEHGAQLMLLAGDLFDSDNIYAQTGEELADALRRFSGQVVIAPGNHDYYSPRSAYAGVLWPDNVHIFTSADWQRLDFPQYGCSVWGAAFTGAEMPPLDSMRCEGSGVKLGVLHGDVGVRDSIYRPITTAQIAHSGLHYLALGHIHAFSGVQRSGGTDWAYPGCPEGHGFDETGDKGFLFGEVTEQGADLRFVPFAGRRYEILEVDICEGTDAVEKALPPHTEEDIYRILLTGETDEQPPLKAMQETLCGRFYALELRDRTRLRRDIWERCGEDSLRGLFLQEMRRQYDTAETDAERARLEQAVRFGLAAMDNREI